MPSESNNTSTRCASDLYTIRNNKNILVLSPQRRLFGGKTTATTQWQTNRNIADRIAIRE
jgi:hypothetical protein